jgi:4-amino-4-deoxy-L-arabinose transferase-like glycosyltransferase
MYRVSKRRIQMPAQTARSALTSQRSLPAVAMFLLGLALILPFQGSRGLWEPDEGRYAAVAVNMLQSGDYLVPHRHPDHSHLSKPPATYWLFAASMTALGQNEWAIRLPGALAFALTLVALARLGRWCSPERPWLPALIYATTLFPFLAANIASTDNLLSALEALIVMAWVEADRVPTRRLYWQLLAMTALSAAFLTKGPPALVPVLALLIMRWRAPQLLPTPLAPPWLWLIGGCAALSWFVWIVLDQPATLDYFLRYELIQRVASDVHNRNPQWYGPLVAYGPVILLGTVPWGLVWLWQRWRCGSAPAQRLASLLRWWLWLPVILFALSRSRLPLYLLPSFVPASLLLAQGLHRVRFSPTARLALAAWVIGLIVLKGLLATLPHEKNARTFAADLQGQVTALPDELVFLNEPAFYGLRFYLGVNVERVSSSADPNKAVDGTLQEELAEPRHDRLWISKCDKLAANALAMESHGLTLIERARIRRYCVYKAQGAEATATRARAAGQLVPQAASP